VATGASKLSRQEDQIASAKDDNTCRLAGVAIFLVSLPAPHLAFATVTAWSSVTYDNSAQGLQGRTIKPALGPPIRFA